MSAQHDVATTGRRPPPGKLGYAEFLEWCDEDTWAEWVDGEIQMVSPASRRHQDVAYFLGVLLRSWAEAHDLGTVLAAPFQMHLPEPVRSGRESDLLFVAAAHRERLRDTYLDGPADLVVEIVSPETVARDRGEKLVEYDAAGVREYWLIDPERQQAEFYQLGPDGRYRLALGGATGLYESPALEGLRLPVEWLWQKPLPKTVDALRALGLTG